MQTPTEATAPAAPLPSSSPGPDRGRWPSVLTSGWLPAGLLWLVTVATLWFFEVPPATTAVFTLYLAAGIALPGTLWWRLLHRGGGFFVADVAAGLALGYVGEVFVYIGARLLGLPLLVLAWPIGTVAVFLLVPSLRRYWRTAADAPVPPLLWRWALTLIAGMTLLWSFKFYRQYGLRYPYNSTPDTDSTFHLALLGEAKHHMPMVVPWITDEPLYYHWFVYPEMAASSWVTGIEPQVLLLRLSVLPMLMAFAVLVAVLARKVTGGWWSGVAASVLTLFALSPTPYNWVAWDFFVNLAFSSLEDGSSLKLTVWTGPTQTFGALLMVPLMIVLVDRLRAPARQWRDPRGWILFTLLLCGVMGAKAIYLPLLFCGLLLVVAVELVFHRTLHRGALTGLGITFGGLVFAQLVLFGGTSQGTELKPFTALVAGALAGTTGYRDKLVLGVLLIFCWVCIWGGLAGLVRRRLPEPAVVAMIGVGVAGAAATLLTGQSGDSQRFFVEGGRPYLAVAAIVGLHALLPAGRMTVRRAGALIGFVVLGMAITQVVIRAGRTDVPTVHSTGSEAALTRAVVLPYAALATAAVVVAVALLLARRRLPALRGMTVALVVALLAGFAINTTFQNYYQVLWDSNHAGWKNVVNAKGEVIVSKGVLEAGRWLRDHSDPDDLVATNAHCQLWNKECSDLHFSMTAYSERRMLVEGWGFTTTAHVQAERLGMWVGSIPYWRPEILADNDAAFSSPSPQTVGILRDRYGVRWLFVDESQNNVSPQLSTFATERYRSGVAVVYELPSA
ncbi:hypothetical protein [Dactylosporangium sp. NPDC050588]|uniref:hypothetical protein n=1 Tax=Dactylosporangium sp. NPDC050588 TaxID=3157211 RepID=UPI0034040C60